MNKQKINCQKLKERKAEIEEILLKYSELLKKVKEKGSGTAEEKEELYSLKESLEKKQKEILEEFGSFFKEAKEWKKEMEIKETS